MLPHDELLHYGVRGMRWGIRSKVAGAYEKSATNKRKEASRLYNGATVLKRAAKEIDANKSSKPIDKAVSAFFKVNAKIGEKDGRRLNKEAKRQEAIAKKIGKAKTVLTKTVEKKNQKKYLTTYQKAAISIGIGTAGMAIGRLMGPTIGSYGKAIEGKIGYDAVRKTASVADDIFKLAASL